MNIRKIVAVFLISYMCFAELFTGNTVCAENLELADINGEGESPSGDPITLNYLYKENEADLKYKTETIYSNYKEDGTSVYPTLPTPSRDYYEFMGWYSYNGGSNPTWNAKNKISGGETIQSKNNINLYAKWDLNIGDRIELHYNVEDESKVTDKSNVSLVKEIHYIKKTVGASVEDWAYPSLPTRLERDGYEFAGWYTDSEGNGTECKAYEKAQTYEVTEGENIGLKEAYSDLYAKWVKTAIGATIELDLSAYPEASYNGNDGYQIVAVMPTSTTPVNEQKYPELADCSLNGYEFLGWYADTADESTKAIEGQTIQVDTEVDENMVTTYIPKKLYAKFKPLTFTIELNGNGQTLVDGDNNLIGASFSVDYGEAFTNLPIPADNANYTFSGWYSRPNGTGTKYTKNSVMELNSRGGQAITIMYACWTEKNYTVTWNYNYTNSPASAITKVGYTSKKLELVKEGPVRSGYEFVEWNTDTSGNGETVEENRSITGDVTFYAIWRVVEVAPKDVYYKVTFKLEENTATTSYEYKYNDAVYTNDFEILVKAKTAIGQLPVVTVTSTEGSFVLDGWYTQGDNQKKLNEDFLVTENISVEARFVRATTINAPTITVLGVNDEGICSEGSKIYLSEEDKDAEIYIRVVSSNLADKSSVPYALYSSPYAITKEMQGIYYVYAYAKKGEVLSRDTISIISVDNEDLGDIEEYFDITAGQNTTNEVIDYLKTLSGDGSVKVPEGLWTYMPLESATYTGSKITFSGTREKGAEAPASQNELYVFYGNRLLVENIDYKVAYSNNVNVDTTGKKPGVITISGRGNYSGKLVKNFTVVPKILPDGVAEKAFPAKKNSINKYLEQKSKVIITDTINGKKVTLKEGRDYKLEYNDYAATGETLYASPKAWDITVKGMGNYKTDTAGKTISYTIYEATDLSYAKIYLKTSSIVYDPKNVDDIDNPETENVIETGYEPAVSKVVLNGKTVPASKYEVQYQNNTYPGQATVIVEPAADEDNEYTGSCTTTFTIKPMAFDKRASIDISKLNNREYDPTIVKYNEETGRRAVIESVEVTRDNPSRDPVNNISTYLSLTYNGEKLIYGSDYYIATKTEKKNGVISYVEKLYMKTVPYTDYFTLDLTPGTHTLYIVGKSETPYAGSVKAVKYTIKKYDLAKHKSQLSVETGSVIHNNGKAVYKPEIKVSSGETQITLDSKYIKYSASGNTKVTNSASLSITGTGYYQGTVKNIVNYSITEQPVDSSRATANDMVASKKAGGFKGNIIILDSVTGKALKAGTDYEKPVAGNTTNGYFYKNDTVVTNIINKKNVIRTAEAGSVAQPNDIVDAGTVMIVKTTCKGNYSGMVQAEYRISKGNISSAKVSVKNLAYTGKAQYLDADAFASVKIGKQSLVYGKDFEIDPASYTKNINAGTATVTIKGTGNYSGTKKITFKIVAKSMNYTINYDANGGTGVIKSGAVLNGGKLARCSFKNGTRKFKGWALTSSATVADFPALTATSQPTLLLNNVLKYPAGKEITLYAVWE